jgi:uncharacterized phiE125 gp8 family phage protein
MAYKQLAAPAIEPLTLADAKRQLNVDQDFTDDDLVIARITAAARQYAETRTRSSFITQQWSLVLDAFPGYWSSQGLVLLEHGPVQSIDSITYLDMAGTVQTMPPADYAADLSGVFGRVGPKFGQVWPVTLPQIGAVTVNFTAGYGATAASVPEGLVHWIMLRIGSLYAIREDVVTERGVTVAKVPFFDGLLDDYWQALV